MYVCGTRTVHTRTVHTRTVHARTYAHARYTHGTRTRTHTRTHAHTHTHTRIHGWSACHNHPHAYISFFLFALSSWRCCICSSRVTWSCFILPSRILRRDACSFSRPAALSRSRATLPAISKNAYMSTNPTQSGNQPTRRIDQPTTTAYAKKDARTVVMPSMPAPSNFLVDDGSAISRTMRRRLSAVFEPAGWTDRQNHRAPPDGTRQRAQPTQRNRKKKHTTTPPCGDE